MRWHHFAIDGQTKWSDFIFADSLLAVVVVVGVVGGGGGDLTPLKLVPRGERVPLHGWLNFSRRFWEYIIIIM